MSWIADPQIWFTLFLLTCLEIILGIDNLVFLSLISSRLPIEQQSKARRLGISLAIISRLLLLALAFRLVYLKTPLFHIGSHPVSIRDIFMLLGGLFLIWKSIEELRNTFTAAQGKEIKFKSTRFSTVVMQIAILDMVFSLDSVMTAVGITPHYWVMAVAIVIAMLMMLFASDYLSRLILSLPRIRILALCFLSLIGVVLLVEGCGVYVPKSYVFVALIFGGFVEIVHIWKERVAS